MMQDLYCRQFGLQEEQVRVICRDVGGSFGIKVHAYPDDFATVALAILLRRPVKFVADRIESFASDIHARWWTAWPPSWGWTRSNFASAT
jgi:carbon-monoxide dehydrogenase large subunit